MKRSRQHKKGVLAAGVLQLELPLFDDTGVAWATLDSVDSPTSEAVQNTQPQVHETEVSNVALIPMSLTSASLIEEVAEFEEAFPDNQPTMNIPLYGVPDIRVAEVQKTMISLRETIIQLLANLSDREREIMTLRFGLGGAEPWTLEQIGKRIGVTRERVRQIETKILRALHHPQYHRLLQPLVILLEADLECSQGVMSCVAAQQLIAVNDGYELRTFEAAIAFVLKFAYTIKKIEDLPIIIFNREPYITFAPHAAEISTIFQQILASAHSHLSKDEVLVRFVADDKGRSIWHQVSESFLIGCLHAHPEIVIDEHSTYQLKGGALTDEPFSPSETPDTITSTLTPALLPVIEPPLDWITPNRPIGITLSTTPADRAIKFVPKPTASGRLGRIVHNATPIIRTPDAYDAWNHALIAYFTESAQRGTTVFLSVDDDIIARIGQHLRATNASELKEFNYALRNRIIRAGRVNLNTLRGRNEVGEPQGVGFLAAMVLAASWMDNEEGISHLDYFNRLRAVLDLPLEDGRPSGMLAGTEEPLWREWALWLQEQGFLPSASRGKEGAQKYIAYPISQALLRDVDKNRLRKLFADKHWPEDWDAETLFARMRREASILSKHLQSVLNSPERFQALAEAIHEVYEAWQDDPHARRGASDAAHSPHLFAWLYRTEDIFSGTVSYYLYPRSSRRQPASQIQIRFDGMLHTVGIDCPGWYMPIGPISVTELDNGGHYSIAQPAELDLLILRQRQFWILKPDPENPDSGVYASWGSIELGTPFILLCRQELIPQLEQLQAELLIKWDNEQRPFAEGNWVELQHCMILSQEWSGISIENKELYDALQPSISVSISTAGGLRVPKVGGWLEGHEPQITIFGFQPQADVCVIRVVDECVVIEQPYDTSVPFDIEWPGPGDYRIEAVCAGDRAERLVKIIPWEHLHLATPEHKESVSIGGWRICGATIELAAN